MRRVRRHSRLTDRPREARRSGTTVRMRDLGVSPVTLADALHASASQRLVRGLCESCREPLQESDMSADESRFAELWSVPAWRDR